MTPSEYTKALLNKEIAVSSLMMSNSRQEYSLKASEITLARQRLKLKLKEACYGTGTCTSLDVFDKIVTWIAFCEHSTHKTDPSRTGGNQNDRRISPKVTSVAHVYADLKTISLTQSQSTPSPQNMTLQGPSSKSSDDLGSSTPALADNATNSRLFLIKTDLISCCNLGPEQSRKFSINQCSASLLGLLYRRTSQLKRQFRSTSDLQVE